MDDDGVLRGVRIIARIRTDAASLPLALMTAPTSHRIGPVTERLALRAFELDDAPAFYELNSHPDVMRHTGEPPCRSVDEARALIAAYPDWNTHGYGRWATVERASGRIVGFAGLKYLDDLQEVDLGYRFLPEFWGRGLATEAGRACLRFGFGTLGLDRIIALALPANHASLRVMQKLGMTRLAPIDFDGHIAEKYAITRATFDMGVG